MFLFRRYGLLLVLLLSGAGKAWAQQYRFVYLQTDNRQPFYVKLNNTLYSSAAEGYLIIPRLTDNTYRLMIGFPKNEFPEQMVEVEVQGKDLGFLLKQFEQKGWGLFNLQTMAVTMAQPADGSAPAAPPVRNEGDFATVLADVVNAPEIAQQKKEAPKTTPPKDKEAQKEKPAVDLAATASPGQQQGVFLWKDETLPRGRKQVYLDRTGTLTDTIEVEWEVVQPPVNKAQDLPVIPVAKSTEEKATAPEKTIEETAVKREPEIKDLPATKPQETAKAELPCKRIAADSDFLKLRKKMASRTNDFDMISDAVKAFKSRCFNTEHVRNLAPLFLNNQGRYSFLDAVFPLVEDPSNYASLSNLLTDEHFQRRFDAMLQN